MLVLGCRKRIVDLISIKNAVQWHFIWCSNFVSLTDLWQLQILVVIAKNILGDTKFLGVVVLAIEHAIRRFLVFTSHFSFVGSSLLASLGIDLHGLSSGLLSFAHFDLFLN